MTKFDALKLDDDDALTIAYQSGFYDGKKAAAQEPTKYSFKAHWEEDGCIGVVAAIERLDGGVHLLKDTIDPPQPAQEQKPMHPQLKAMLEEYFDKCFAESSTQRPWVGLTDDEFKKMIDDAGFTRTDLLMIGACVEQLVDLLEAKLKEKNT